MTDIATIRSDALTVTVSPIGAELQSVTDAAGAEWFWNGDPAFWAGRAPILFPTVGALNGGVARFDGQEYPMAQHGFARRRPFAIAARTDASVTFRLEADAESRAHYPFAFRLDVTHRLDGATLETILSVTNRDDRPMPAGAGFHPAVRWPLPGAGARNDHIIRFEADEPEPIRSVIAGGLIGRATKPTPVHENEIALHDSLFAEDALVFDRPINRSLWFGVPGRPGVRADYAGMPMLGIWTRPGAGYLCIEPWHARADDEGFTGEFADKPHVVTLAPGETRDFAMALTFGVPG